jgi:hypothetical protein
MPVIEDIAQDLESEAGSTSPGPPATARPQRGHAAKIGLAVAALRADGLLPLHLRPVQRDRLILEWLIAEGYGDDLPSRRAIKRYFEGCACNAPQSPQSPNDRCPDAA